jgi:microcystin-dependent protein
MITPFPPSPSINDEFDGYRWDGTAWELLGIDLNKNYAEVVAGKISTDVVPTTFATKTYADTAVSTAISNLIDAAPSTLDTLNELAAAINDDPNFATTITALIATKLDSVPGMISEFAGSTVPTGWLLCNGSSVSRTTYPSLFSTLTLSKGTFTVTIATPAVFTLTSHGLVTGSQVYLTTTGALPTGLAANTNYFVVSTGANTFNLATSFANATATSPVVIATSGTQSGTHTLVHAPYGVASSTTFNLPNLSGRTPAGIDTSQTEFNTLGEFGGAKTVTLATSEMPVHSHANTLGTATVAASGHIHYATGQGGDLRTAIGATASDAGSLGYQPTGVISPGPTSIGAYTLLAGFTQAVRGFNHYTPVYGYTSGNSANATVTISNANPGGSGTPTPTTQPHNNLQPYVVLNYIIKH